MTSGFTKLYNQIITSSIWSEDDKVRIMWITFLASADAQGYVSGSIPGMAAISRMSLADAERSIEVLCSPDKYSRSSENEGRRIEPVDGGWIILNHAKYREKRDPEQRRKQNRESQARYRSKQKVSQSKPRVSQSKPKTEDRRQIPPISPKGELTDSFNKLWNEYPKKAGKKEAYKSWERINPNEELFSQILTALENQKKSSQWTRENGRFIPLASTWLNQERWNDEIEVTPEQVNAVPFDHEAAAIREKMLVCGK